jgi:hypothetical protein
MTAREIDDLLEDEDTLEIPMEEVLGSSSSRKVDFYPDADSDDHNANLVGKLSEKELSTLGEDVRRAFDADNASRQEWKQLLEAGLDLLGLKIEELHEPFEGACSATHPLLLESAVNFQSKASTELLPADGPARFKIFGDVTLEKEKIANRLKDHLNYQLTEEMEEFYPDTERMLLYLALMGSGFKKVYYSAELDRVVSEFVDATDVVVPNSASDLFRTKRFSVVLKKSRGQLEKAWASGFYSKPEDFDMIGSEDSLLDDGRLSVLAESEVGIDNVLSGTKEEFTLIEHYCMLCFDELDRQSDEFDIPSPYIVTVDYDTGTVLSVRRNWKESDEGRTRDQTLVEYHMVPGFGFYGLGFFHLLGNLQMTLTAALRTLVDSGQFASMQGGFKLKGVRIVDDGRPIAPGQYKDIEAATMDINKALMPLPFKEPSSVLFTMLDFLDKKGKQFADSTEQIVANASNYGPVGTTMALLDASGKFFSAVHKRLHRSLKRELRLIAKLNSEVLNEDTPYNTLNDLDKRITRNDYKHYNFITPVSDPNVSSAAHRMAKAQALFQFAAQQPGVHNMREVLKLVYGAMDVHNMDKILPPEVTATPNDPMTDLKFLLEGKPIKAFKGQDHDAHIAVKQSFLMSNVGGGSQLLTDMAQFLQANMREHLVLKFQEQVEAQQRYINKSDHGLGKATKSMPRNESVDQIEMHME